MAGGQGRQDAAICGGLKDQVNTFDGLDFNDRVGIVSVLPDRIEDDRQADIGGGVTLGEDFIQEGGGFLADRGGIELDVAFDGVAGEDRVVGAAGQIAQAGVVEQAGVVNEDGDVVEQAFFDCPAQCGWIDDDVGKRAVGGDDRTGANEARMVAAVAFGGREESEVGGEGEFVRVHGWEVEG